jgi:hypothetical protein
MLVGSSVPSGLLTARDRSMQASLPLPPPVLRRARGGFAARRFTSGRAWSTVPTI